MNVEAILRNKGSTVATVQPDATVGEAVALLRRKAIGALVVSGDGRAVDGILSERDLVHRVIYEELCLGKLVDGSRDAYRRIIAALTARGAQAVILGCTEISLLVGQADAAVPLFDTTALHARGAAECALGLAVPTPPEQP